LNSPPNLWVGVVSLNQKERNFKEKKNPSAIFFARQGFP
jgi:hypothetical protein